jgi:hypothetical protein
MGPTEWLLARYVLKKVSVFSVNGALRCLLPFPDYGDSPAVPVNVLSLNTAQFTQPDTTIGEQAYHALVRPPGHTGLLEVRAARPDMHSSM